MSILEPANQKIDVLDKDLEVDSSAIGLVKWAGFPSPVSLTQHDLRTFRSLEIGKSACSALICDLKA